MQTISTNDNVVRTFTIDASIDGAALRISIRGELDIATHDQLLSRLQHALTLVQTDGTTAVHLQLSDLAFCDARGACHLREFAGQVRQAGGDITLDGVRRPVRRLITVLGLQDELQVA